VSLSRVFLASHVYCPESEEEAIETAYTSPVCSSDPFKYHCTREREEKWRTYTEEEGGKECM